jgi:hypothetical protein
MYLPRCATFGLKVDAVSPVITLQPDGIEPGVSMPDAAQLYQA